METFEDVINLMKQEDDTLNYDGLVEAFEGINLVIGKINSSIYGLATFDAVYINYEGIFLMGVDMFYFLLLHELAHHKRILKLGVPFHLNGLSLTNFDELLNFVINEEIIADRYGTFIYLILNGKEYEGETQNLELEYNRNMYAGYVVTIHNKIGNDIEKYNELVESMFNESEI